MGGQGMRHWNADAWGLVAWLTICSMAGGGIGGFVGVMVWRWLT